MEDVIEYHWVITAQTYDGNVATYDGQIGVQPGPTAPCACTWRTR